MARSVEVIAWRGNSHDHLENTLPAVLGIPPYVNIQEVDTRLTSDNELIAFHSPTMRVTGDPRSICDVPWSELRDKRFKKKRVEYTIPLVNELLANSDSIFMLHIKREVDVAAYVQAVSDLSRPCLFHSNSTIHLASIKGHANVLGLFKSIYTPSSDGVIDFVDGYMCGHKAFMPVTSLEDWWLRDLREAGKLIYVFAGTTERWMKEVLEFDVDGLLTNRFSRAANLLGIGGSRES